MNDFTLYIDNFQKNKDIKSIFIYGKKRLNEYFDLSFVIPTYKRLDGLKKAIDSIYYQETCGIKFEIVIVDNEQFDFAGSKMQSLLEIYDPNIIRYYQNTENIGMFGNLNRCIELASSEWIAMLHDDDIVMEDYFVKIKQILWKLHKEKNIAYIKARHIMVPDLNTETLSKYSKVVSDKRKKYASRLVRISKLMYGILGPDSIGEYGAPTCGTLINREIFLQNGGYDESHYPTSDAFLPEKLVCQKGYKIYITFGYLGFYLLSENATLKESTIVGFINEYCKYCDYYRNRDIVSKLMYALFSNEMAIIYMDWILKLIKGNPLIRNEKELKECIYNKLGFPKENKIKIRIYQLIKNTFMRYQVLLAISKR